MSTHQRTAAETKLLHYSTVRRRAEHKDRIPNVEIEQILSNMVTDLTCEDRFVVYACQRALAAVLKTYSLQDLSVIQDILEDWSKVQHHSVCLEICSELLSRHCNLCQFYSEHLSKPLSRYCQEFFKEKDYKVVFVWNTSCMHCLFKIFYKYTKLIALYNCTDALKFIQSILHDFKSTLIDILFNEELPEYIGRRLIRLLCSLLRCDNCEKNTDLYSVMLHFNDMTISALDEMDLEKVVCKTSVDVFTGQDSCADPRGHAVDMVHLREWSFFIISSLARKSSQDMSTVIQILNRLHCVVKHTLGMKHNIFLSWIEEVFCDQDDKWIELLLVLMNMSSQRSEQTESLQIKNHWYFLQFMSCTAFDHQVLIDFLTSPETSFLQYLTRYLKHLISSWTDFQSTVDIFEKRWCIEEHLDVNGSTLCTEMKTRSLVALKEKTLCVDRVLFNMKDPHKESRADQVISNNYLSELDAFCGKFKRTDSKIHTNVNDKSFEEVEIPVLEGVTAGKNLLGLGMIGNAYSDSEDTDDSGDDIDGNSRHVESGKADNVDFKSSTRFIRDKSDNTLLGKILQIRDSNKENMSDGESIKPIKSLVFKQDSIASIDVVHCETDSDRLDDSIVYIEETQINANLEHDINGKLEESDYVESLESCGSDQDHQEINTNIMDSVMSTLIRVRLKLESLWENDVIGFNPNPLVKLLVQVENLYENG